MSCSFRTREPNKLSYSESMTKRALVDPLFVFDERGRSLKSYEQLEAEVRRLEAENERFRRYIRMRILRDGVLTQPSITRH